MPPQRRSERSIHTQPGRLRPPFLLQLQGFPTPMRFFRPVCSLVAASAACLISAAATAQSAEPAGDNHVAVGLGVLLDRAPFNGDTTQIYPIPLISLKQGAFYIETTEMGLARAVGTGMVEVGGELFVAARNRSGRDRAKLTVDGGARLWVSTPAGRFSGEVRHDITGTFGGTELIARYSYPIEIGKLTITPAAQLNWMDRRSANYLYGITAEQRAKMIANHRAVVLPVAPITRHATNLGGDLTFAYVIGDHWSVLGVASGSYLGKPIRRSPAIGQEWQSSIVAGVAYRF